jgi:hypothetical protein
MLCVQHAADSGRALHLEIHAAGPGVGFAQVTDALRLLLLLLLLLLQGPEELPQQPMGCP